MPPKGQEVLTLSVLITTILVYNPFYYPSNLLLLETKCVLKHQELQKFGIKVNKYDLKLWVALARHNFKRVTVFIA